MKNINSRLAELEAARFKSDSRTMSDLELAVRIDYAIRQGGPLADQVLAFLAAASKNGESDDA